MPKTIESRPEPSGGAGRSITAFRGNYPAGAHLPPHRHARGQLVYGARGTMTVTVAATARRQGGAWVVPPSQALWIPPRLTHAIRMTGAVAMRTLYLRGDVAGFLPEQPQVLGVSSLLRELILRMMELPRSGDRGRDVGRHVTALILDELRAAPNLQLRLPMPRDARLLRLCRALLENPGDERKLPELARHAGASPRNLARLFQAELGMSFTAWRQQARLLEALRRLGAGEPVTTVALDLGYATPSAFTYMFRRALGAPPSRFFAAAQANGRLA
jgi:AraC-like DNA-binding protein